MAHPHHTAKYVKTESLKSVIPLTAKRDGRRSLNSSIRCVENPPELLHNPIRIVYDLEVVTVIDLKIDPRVLFRREDYLPIGIQNIPLRE